MGVERRLFQHRGRGDPQAQRVKAISARQEPDERLPIRAADYPHIHAMIFAATSPMPSSTAAHTNAEVKLAIWNSQAGIRKMPATSGTEARSGPKKRPMKIASTPPRFTKASPRGNRSGWRDSGQTWPTAGPSLSPTQ